MLQDNCSTCRETEQFCVCTDCDVCFSKIYENSGHTCLTCNNGILDNICFDNSGQCDNCAGIEDIEIDEEELKKIDAEEASKV